MAGASSLFARSTFVIAGVAAGLLSAATAFAQPSGGQPAPAPPAQTAPAQGTAPAAAAMKVAIVDTQKILRETEEGMRIEANLRKIFDSKQADLITKEKALSQEYEELAKQQKAAGGKVSPALQAKIEDFKVRYQTYQQAQLEFRNEFQRKQSELYNPMLQKVYAIVKNIAQADAFDAVIDKQAAVWFRRDLDITERVIQAYNAGDNGTSNPAIGGPAPKQEPKQPKPKAEPKKKKGG